MLEKYIVSYWLDGENFVFECMAESTLHAKEQCVNFDPSVFISDCWAESEEY